ncbi:MAG: hypothetical protein SCK29_05020 [Bacillota bacterium]|nr:hypothetical protein [Bacillota bacterium]MDW7683467.1 hypothetical protein [Bacillota bacterium]
MEKVPFLALLFHSFPESVFLGVAGLLFVGVRPRLDRAILFGIVQAVSAYAVRLLDLPLGYHTMILVVLASVYTSLLYGIRFRKSLVALILSFLLLIIAEAFFVTLVLNYTTLTVETIMAPENAMIRVLVALPQILTLALASFAAWRIRGFHLSGPRFTGRF